MTGLCRQLGAIYNLDDNETVGRKAQEEFLAICKCLVDHLRSHVHGDDKLMEKHASCWYHVAYSDDEEVDGLPTRRLSFAWINYLQLVTIKKRNNIFITDPITLNDSNAAANILGRRVFDYFKQKEQGLVESLELRLRLLKEIQERINIEHPEAELLMFGSSASFIFENEESDLDLVLVNGPSLSDIAKSGLFSDFSLDFKNASIPILKGQADLGFHDDDSAIISFDISDSFNGLQKLFIIKTLLIKDHNKFLALWALTNWGKKSETSKFHSVFHLSFFSSCYPSHPPQ